MKMIVGRLDVLKERLVFLSISVFVFLMVLASCYNTTSANNNGGNSSSRFAVYLSKDTQGTRYDLVVMDPSVPDSARIASSEGPSYRLVVTRSGDVPKVEEGTAERPGLRRIIVTRQNGANKTLEITLDSNNEISGINGDFDADIPAPNGQLTPYHLYLAGYIGNFNNPSYPYFNSACYWNGKSQVELPSPAGKKSWAGAITVKKGMVYVAGCYEELGNGYGATGCYWVNGVRHDLSDGAMDSSNVHKMSIAVTDNGDVYVGGLTAKSPDAYWKNGQKIIVTETGKNTINVSSVTVSGNDVYLAGCTLVEGEQAVPCYWKNGVKNDLAYPLASSMPQDITVSGGNVYILGDSGNYWKNGSQTALASTGQYHSIFVDGNDLYVGGYTDRTGNGYWKNNEAFKSFGIQINYVPVAVAASGGNVYVAAALGSNTITPGYWINNTRIDVYTPLALNFHGHIMDICLVEP